jgi:hypothetical protein
LALIPGLVAGREALPRHDRFIPHRPAPGAWLLERDDVRLELGVASEWEAVSLPRIERSLGEAQRIRLSEIRIQLAGPIAVLDPQVQDRLDLSPDQRARLAEAERSIAVSDDHAILDSYEERLLRGFAFKRALGEVVAEVLTPNQRAELKRLGGRPFPSG